MDLVFEDKKARSITKREDIKLSIDAPGLYLFEIIARSKGEKQVRASDDEDLRVEIDGRKFSQLNNREKYFDSPAAFSGGELHGLKKAVLFILPLNSGKHLLSLIPDISSKLERIRVFKISSGQNVEKLELPLDLQAEDGDRRPLLTMVLANVSLISFSVSAVLKKRFIDSDDLKVIIDGRVQRNYRSFFHKFWYFIAFLTDEEQKDQFSVNCSPGLHYVEFWADRMPTLKTLTLFSLSTQLPEESIEEKIRKMAQEYNLDSDLMVKLAKKESQFDPKATSHVGAKGLFQLMDITITQIARLGFTIDNPYDVDQNIKGGTIYFKWLYEMYEGDPERLEKTLAAWNWGQNNFPKIGPLDYGLMPDETKNFIHDILGK